MNREKELHSITKEAAKFCKELSILELPKDGTKLVTAYAKRVKKMEQKLQESWKERMMQVKYPHMFKDADVDQQKTNQWLRSTGLKGETESLMTAGQDLSLACCSYHHH